MDKPKPLDEMPDWAIPDAADKRFQDIWDEAFDPDCDVGALVTAHYEVSTVPVDDINPHADNYADWQDFRGIVVDDGETRTYYDRRSLVNAGFSVHHLDGWVNEIVGSLV